MRPIARPDRITDRTGTTRSLLAVSSVAAGLIHAAVVPEHLEETWIFGLFFIAGAGFQIAWAIPIVVGRSVAIYVTGALVNGAIIATWLVSRTIGVPIGPDAWMPEPAAALDVSATLLELIVVVGSLILLRQRAREGAVTHRAGSFRGMERGSTMNATGRQA